MNYFVITIGLLAMLLSILLNKQKIKPVSVKMFNFNKSAKLPVYFFSHGGPTFMYPDDESGDKGAFNTIKKLGTGIKEEIKPDFIIVVSAHWQSSAANLIEINYPSEKLSSLDQIGDNEHDLIYDFYGFPDHMYKEKFHSKGSKAIAQDIANTLSEGGLQSQITARGIDHGVWVPFKVAFTDSKSLDSHKWDLDMPIVQVSLTSSSQHDVHFKLGQLLAPYREKNGLIICSGMSVHNLGDWRKSMVSPTQLAPYLKPFNKLLTEEIVSKTGVERLAKFNELFTPKYLSLYKGAHPTNEHFMPIVVASGAAENEIGQELYNNAKFSLGWGIYQFGN